jgi:hypothetical protein
MMPSPRRARKSHQRGGRLILIRLHAGGDREVDCRKAIRFWLEANSGTPRVARRVTIGGG